jgi:hypothetical protein
VFLPGGQAVRVAGGGGGSGGGGGGYSSQGPVIDAEYTEIK